MDAIAHAKNNVIEKIFKDPAGHGSVNETYQDAKKADNTITMTDVKKWFDTNRERKHNLKGFNSYVAPKAFFEYQARRFFHERLE